MLEILIQKLKIYGGIFLKNKTITVFLLITVLVIYAIYFILQGFIFSFGQPIVTQLDNIISYAHENKWQEAESALNELISIWNKQRYLLAFNYAESDYSLFVDSLARLKGAINGKDKAETTGLASSSLALWKNFIKLIPQP